MRNGHRNGDYLAYDVFGNIQEKGSFRNDMKTGQWINYKTKETMRYKWDTVIIKDSTNQKNNFFRRIFIKRDSIQKVKDNQERLLTRNNDSINKAKEKRKRVLKRKNDSIQKAKVNQKRVLNRKHDSIEKVTKNKKPEIKKVDSKGSFFERLFRKKSQN